MRKASTRWLPLLGLALLSAGCSTVTMRESGTGNLTSEPTYSDSKSFFLWGLVGEHHVDLPAVCGGKAASQWQAQNTFVDGLLGVITLGIYAPRTANVWCSAEKGTN